MYTDDLATLETLSEEAIVDQLQKRYTQNQIYTYIGDILVAVNPFTDIGIYTTKVTQYKIKCLIKIKTHIFKYFFILFLSRHNSCTKVVVAQTIRLISTQ